MKALLKFLSFLAVLTFFFAPGLLRAQDDSDDQGASFQTFYDQLGSQGTWVQTDDYGYVFQPNVQDPDWAPYTDGHWVYTDQGWTWVSDEPWGWATYHYGRWINIDGEGWVWVPGYRWAPAWVSWRYGGGYCGWAPLPPDSFVGAEYGEPGGGANLGFHFGNDVDVNFHIGAGEYNFVRVGDMGETNYRGHYANRENNFSIINGTRNITNINVSNNGATGANFRGVAAGGPPIAEVNSRSRQHVQTVQLTAATQAGPAAVQGNSLAVFAPKVNPASAGQAKPATVARTIDHPTFNRGDSITKPLAVSASLKPAAPSAAAIQAATTAQRNAPASAKIVTDKTPIKTTLTRPLTSLAPVTPAARTTAPAATGESAVNPNVEHNAAAAPFTGESVKPAVSQPNEEKPASAAVSNQAEQQAQAAQEEKARQQQESQAQQEQKAQQQQQSQAQQEARQQQQAQAQQEQKAQQQQQSQAQQEARQQQQAQAQQEEKAEQQQQSQAQQEARQQQQAQQEARQQQQAQQEVRQQQQAQSEPSHQQQTPQEPSHQQQAPQEPSHQQQAQPQASHPQPAPAQAQPKTQSSSDNKKPDPNKPAGQ